MARRKLVWARLAPGITSLTRINGALGGGIESQDLLQDYRTFAGLIRGPVGVTVVRIRMSIEWHADTGGDSVSIRQNGFYYGVRVAEYADVATQEATEVPNRGPQLDPYADWMAWGCIPAKFTYQPTAPATPIVSGWEDVDVRSMRKMDELGQTLQLVLQSTLPTAGPGPVVRASTSVLLALP